MTYSIFHHDNSVASNKRYEKEDDFRTHIRSEFPDAWFGDFEHDRHSATATSHVFESKKACEDGMDPIAMIEWNDDDPEVVRAAEQWAESVEIRVAQLPPGEFEKTGDSAKTRRDNNTIRHEMSNYDELCQHRFA